MNPAIHIGVVIPVYNHEHAIVTVLAAVLQHQLHCVLVDDGCHATCAEVLKRLATQEPQRVTLLRHAITRCNGSAVITGLQYLAQQGYSNALQIDADGQHEVTGDGGHLGAAQVLCDERLTEADGGGFQDPAARTPCGQLEAGRVGFAGADPLEHVGDRLTVPAAEADGLLGVPVDLHHARSITSGCLMKPIDVLRDEHEQSTTMLELDEQAAKLCHLNTRPELHGDELACVDHCKKSGACKSGWPGVSEQ